MDKKKESIRFNFFTELSNMLKFPHSRGHPASNPRITNCKVEPKMISAPKEGWPPAQSSPTTPLSTRSQISSTGAAQSSRVGPQATLPKCAADVLNKTGILQTSKPKLIQIPAPRPFSRTISTTVIPAPRPQTQVAQNPAPRPFSRAVSTTVIHQAPRPQTPHTTPRRRVTERVKSIKRQKPLEFRSTSMFYLDIDHEQPSSSSNIPSQPQNQRNPRVERAVSVDDLLEITNYARNDDGYNVSAVLQPTPAPPTSLSGSLPTPNSPIMSPLNVDIDPYAPAQGQHNSPSAVGQESGATQSAEEELMSMEILSSIFSDGLQIAQPNEAGASVASNWWYAPTSRDSASIEISAILEPVSSRRLPMEFTSNSRNGSTGTPSPSTSIPSTSNGTPSQSPSAPSSSNGNPRQSTSIPSRSNGILNRSTSVPSTSTGTTSRFPSIPYAGNGYSCPSTSIPSTSNGTPSRFPSIPSAGNGNSCPSTSIPSTSNGTPSRFPSIPSTGNGNPSPCIPIPSTSNGTPSASPSIPYTTTGTPSLPTLVTFTSNGTGSSTSVPSTSNRTTTPSTSTPSTSIGNLVNSSSPSVTGIDSLMSHDPTLDGLKLRERVVWFTDKDVAHVGIIKWLGKLDGKHMAGVEFDNHVGNSSGKWNGRQLFTVALTKGRFVPIAQLILLSDYTQRLPCNEPAKIQYPSWEKDEAAKETEDVSTIICVICQDSLLNWHDDEEVVNSKTEVEQGMISTQCGHLFHHACLKQWFNIKKKPIQPCPYCQRPVPIADVIRIYPVQGK